MAGVSRNGTVYYYVVSGAFSGSPDAGGASAESSEAAATPQGAGPTPPAAPKNLTTQATKSGPINLNWVQSITPGITQNSIYRRTTETSYSLTPLATIAATTAYQDASVVNQPPFCYVVSAIDAAGHSASSNESCTATH